MRLATAACFGLLAIGSSFAHDRGGDAARLALGQKERLVRQLLEDSPLTRQVQSSTSEEARALLSAARLEYKRAQDRMQAADLGAAEAALNEVIWMVGKARQLVPDRIEHLIGERVRYTRLKSLVDAMRLSYLRSLGLTQQQVAEPGDADLARVDALVDEARRLADADRLLEANKALESAELALMHGLTRVLGGATLRYGGGFATEEEEFAFELARNSSYLQLVPLALREFRPSAAVVAAVDARVAGNAATVEQARGFAARRDWSAALREIRAGTQQLQAALSAAGLVMPAEAVVERTR